MSQWEILKNKLKEEYGITFEEEIYSLHSKIKNGNCATEYFSYDFNYVAKRYKGNYTYVERYHNVGTIPPAVASIIGNMISVTTGFYGTDSNGKKAWYDVEYFYREENPNNITITSVTPRLEDLDDLVQVEYNNDCTVYAAFKKGDKLIVQSFIGESKTFDMSGNTVVALNALDGHKPGIDETEYIFFSFDDNNIYLNKIEGTLYTELEHSGYEVDLNSSKIFTSKNSAATIKSIEPVYHNNDGCTWYTFHYTDKFTVIVTYSDGKKQLLVINNIASPKQQVFRSKLYDDIKHKKGNFHCTFDTNGQPVKNELGLMFEFTRDGKTEYHFIPEEGPTKGKRRVYRRMDTTVPAKPDDDDDENTDES